MKIISCIFIIYFSLQSSAQGLVDGYFKGQKNCDIALTGAYQKSSIYYKGLNKIEYARDLAIVNLFAEYGITKSFDVITSVPFINGKFQDMSIFLKYDLIHSLFRKIKRFGANYDKPFHIIPAIGISFPMTNYVTQSWAAIGQRATVVQAKLIFQYNLGSFFIQAQGGYNYALSPVTSSYTYSSKIGFSKNRIYTDFWFDHQEALGGEDYTSNSIDFRELGVSYNRFGGVLYYSFKKNKNGPSWGTFLNYSYIINGRNTGQAFTIGAGLVLSIKNNP